MYASPKNGPRRLVATHGPRTKRRDSRPAQGGGCPPPELLSVGSGAPYRDRLTVRRMGYESGFGQVTTPQAQGGDYVRTDSDSRRPCR